MLIQALKKPINLVRMGVAWDVVRKKMRKQRPAAPKLKDAFVLPWQNTANDTSFGHAQSNSYGLQLKFFKTDGGLGATWTPSAHFQNYPGLIHGGVVSAVLDELMGQAILEHTGFVSVSTKMSIRWVKGSRFGETFSAAARVTLSESGLYEVKSQLFNEKGRLCAEADGIYFTPTQKQILALTGMKDVPAGTESLFKAGT